MVSVSNAISTSTNSKPARNFTIAQHMVVKYINFMRTPHELAT
jgi:hypothetical protein